MSSPTQHYFRASQRDALTSTDFPNGGAQVDTASQQQQDVGNSMQISKICPTILHLEHSQTSGRELQSTSSRYAVRDSKSPSAAYEPLFRYRKLRELTVSIAMAPLEAPIVNESSKYGDKAVPLHQYGQYLMSCLPKFVQQYSVWKDELCIYMSVTPVRLWANLF